MTAVPTAVDPAAADPGTLEDLAALVADGDVVVLSGAGLSTDSGIPDYRGATGSLRRHTPMTYQTFLRDPRGRHRYWARSFVGWRQIRAARPNAGHRAVAELQAAGLLSGVITQNVDGLHQAAGARDVLELHGGLDRTVCLACGDVADRGELHERLHAVNPHFGPHVDEVNPDGDAELPDELLDGFVMVDCLACGRGPLSPTTRGRAPACSPSSSAATGSSPAARARAPASPGASPPRPSGSATSWSRSAGPTPTPWSRPTPAPRW